MSGNPYHIAKAPGAVPAPIPSIVIDDGSPDQRLEAPIPASVELYGCSVALLGVHQCLAFILPDQHTRSGLILKPCSHWVTNY